MGFPSPADDYVQARLDIADYLVKHPAATFFMRAETGGMARAGIHAGDVLVVDRSIPPRDGHIVIAAVHGDLHVRRLRVRDGKPRLIATDARVKLIEIDDADCVIWGVVTFAIHRTAGDDAE